MKKESGEDGIDKIETKEANQYSLYNSYFKYKKELKYNHKKILNLLGLSESEFSKLHKKYSKNNIKENKMNKKQLLENYIKRIVKKTLLEYNGNPKPSKKSNWYKFAELFDMGTLDLHAFADRIGYRDFHDLDISISPLTLYTKNEDKFIDALQKSSLIAEDMNEYEISSLIEDKLVY
jgi:hypothetical protein